MYTGLTKLQVEELRKRFGLNQLPTPSYRFLKLVARHISGLFNILLLVAAGVTLSLEIGRAHV